MNSRKRNFPTENSMNICPVDEKRSISEKRHFGQSNSTQWNKHEQFIKSKFDEDNNRCFICSRPITDQYVYKIFPGIKIHKKCLKCEECGKLLDEDMTCFFQASKVYCTADYARLFIGKCLKCQCSFGPEDSVIRFNTRAFHCDCFKCDTCQKSIQQGEEFVWQEGSLQCRVDWEDRKILQKDSVRSNIDESKQPLSISSNGTKGSNDPVAKIDTETPSNPPKKPKTTRVRTVLNEKQLQTLRSCYNTNPRPDALVKEQLCELTGLTSRVIRVWFQNKRCKDKKRSIMLKQLQEQERLREISRAAVPMIAASPITTNDLSGHMGQVDIIPYHNHHWKQIQQPTAYSIQSNHELGHTGAPQLAASYDSHAHYYSANAPNQLNAQTNDGNVTSYAGMYINDQPQNCCYDEISNNTHMR